MMNLAIRGIEADLIECMVALPGQLFTNTQIPPCIWFLTKNTATVPATPLFIDVRNLGYMIDWVLRAFSAEDLEKIAGYADVLGFCKSTTSEETVEHSQMPTWDRNGRAQKTNASDRWQRQRLHPTTLRRRPCKSGKAIVLGTASPRKRSRNWRPSSAAPSCRRQNGQTCEHIAPAALTLSEFLVR